MADEKDRFGDKLRDVEKGREDQYFAERDRELLQRSRAECSSQLKEAASMCCPKCGKRLVTSRRLDVTVEECPACNGMWLDKGDLEQIARRENGGWLARYLGRGR